MQGGIIASALQLIKEKEKQGDKAMERLHDGMKTQMELTQSQGSWTGSSQPSKVVKEKVVEKEKTKEPEEEAEKPAESAPAAPGASEEEQEKDVANMGILDMAKGASK